MFFFITIIFLILFIYSISYISKSLLELSGNRFIILIKKISNNNLLLFIIGIFLTALIQSSSASSIIIMSFVNSKIIKLKSSIYFILGSNIGTCITNQLLAFNTTYLGPLLIIVSIILLLIKKPVYKVILGLGILFISMNIISTSLLPLKDNIIFINLISKFDNNYLAIIIGMFFTFVIQSSSASIAMYQALAFNEIITLNSAVYLLLGSNIGTCITGLIGSIGLNKDSKRIAFINILINIIGVIIFLFIIKFIYFDSSNKSRYIANIHLFFNIFSSIIMYPFVNILYLISKKIIK